MNAASCGMNAKIDMRSALQQEAALPMPQCRENCVSTAVLP